MAAMQEGAGLGLEAFSPTEVEKRVEDAACAKAALPMGRCFVSAMLAGAFIGFGGMFFCTFLSDATLPFAVQRLVGGVCFCLGLVLVLCCGAELFTGNVLMVCSRVSGRVPWRAVLGNWGLVWLGNLAGSLAAMALVLLANVQGMNGGEVGATFVSVASAKASLGPVELFFKAVMCNVLVCLAVWIGFASRSVTDKVVGILLPIAAFVACGFEHCEHVLPLHGHPAERSGRSGGRRGRVAGRRGGEPRAGHARQRGGRRSGGARVLVRLPGQGSALGGEPDPACSAAPRGGIASSASTYRAPPPRPRAANGRSGVT